MSTENANPKVEASVPQDKFEWVPSPHGLFETYCNFTQTSWSLYDLRVAVGEIKPTHKDSPKFVVEERAAITMAWPQAKQLLIGLGQLVKSYEDLNGEIKPLKLPPDPASPKPPTPET